jgi:hypothetical protein
VDGADFTRAIDILREKYAQYRAMDLQRDRGALVRLRADRILAWRAWEPATTVVHGSP